MHGAAENPVGSAPAGARSDVFSFGVVVYEMLTGRHAFTGDSTASVLAAVLREDPSALGTKCPREVERIVAQCLRKDPGRRFQHMDDVKVELEDLKGGSQTGELHVGRRQPRWRRVATISIAATALSISFPLYRWIARRSSEPFARIEFVRLTDTGRASVPAISPDGKWVAHADSYRGDSSLWIRHVATGDSTRILAPVPGTFTTLEFSRDRNSLYYVFNSGKPRAPLHKISRFWEEMLSDWPRSLEHCSRNMDC